MAQTSTRKLSKLSIGVGITAIILTLLTVLGISVGIHNANVTSRKVSVSDYEIGAITEEGKIVDSKLSIYMEEAETVDGLEIELDSDSATVTYKVAFYDEDGKFLSMTEEQTGDFDNANVPENAKSFRIVITPYEVDGESVKLNVFNKSEYIKQLTVRYNI